MTNRDLIVSLLENQTTKPDPVQWSIAADALEDNGKSDAADYWRYLSKWFPVFRKLMDSHISKDKTVKFGSFKVILRQHYQGMSIAVHWKEKMTSVRWRWSIRKIKANYFWHNKPICQTEVNKVILSVISRMRIMEKHGQVIME